MNFLALRYEELALNAFPQLHTEVYDGWILRFTSDNDNRNNCVVPLYLSTRSYEDKIEYCEEKFRVKGLNPRFKMTANVSGALDQQLAMRGYELEDRTRIMECSLTDMPPMEPRNGQTAAAASILLSHSLEPEWMNAYLSLDSMEASANPQEIRSMLESIRNPVYCAALVEGNTVAGCGLGVLEDGKIGLYDIRVEGGMRRKGIGAAICRAIMEEGRLNGANKAFLHVNAANRPAAALYESIGFHEVYLYWYRTKRA